MPRVGGELILTPSTSHKLESLHVHRLMGTGLLQRSEAMHSPALILL